eukprot:266380-Rhodomonas_salina.2
MGDKGEEGQFDRCLMEGYEKRVTLIGLCCDGGYVFWYSQEGVNMFFQYDATCIFGDDATRICARRYDYTRSLMPNKVLIWGFVDTRTYTLKYWPRVALSYWSTCEGY